MCVETKTAIVVKLVLRDANLRRHVTTGMLQFIRVRRVLIGIYHTTISDIREAFLTIATLILGRSVKSLLPLFANYSRQVRNTV